MRLIACMGLGREKKERVAYKTAEIETQKEEAIQFREEIQRETEALIRRLKAEARLRGGGDDAAYPRSSR